MAIDPDELEPRKPAAQKRNLDVMGLAELQAYIAELETEIARAKSAIAAKQSVRAGAEALFKR